MQDKNKQFEDIKATTISTEIILEIPLEEKAKAKKIVELVVNMIAEKQYEKIFSVSESENLTVEIIKEMFENYLDEGLTHIDKFNVPCNFNPQYKFGAVYEQMSFYAYNDDSGFAVNYDLTTDGEINDLTLQMEFNYNNGKLKAILLDIHVM